MNRNDVAEEPVGFPVYARGEEEARRSAFRSIGTEIHSPQANTSSNWIPLSIRNLAAILASFVVKGADLAIAKVAD
jgi:hypothetical protein